MPPVLPCPSCGRHVLILDAICPHCHAAMPERSTPSSVSTPAALALGLSLVGCVPVGGVSDYGTSGYDKYSTDTDYTYSETDADVDTDTDADADSDADTDTSSTAATGTTETGTSETAGTGDTSTPTGTTTGVDYGTSY